MPPKKDRPKNDRPLAPKELKFVAFYEGNQVKAAQKAGYKFPKAVASAVFNRPQVRAAIKKKQAAFFDKLGKNEARGVKITRNDIINRLDRLSQKAETDSARVMALRELKDIFGLSARKHANIEFLPVGTITNSNITERLGISGSFWIPTGLGRSGAGNPETSELRPVEDLEKSRAAASRDIQARAVARHAMPICG